MELIECGDCGSILTEDELNDPVYNEVWYEVCDVCLMGWGFKPEFQLSMMVLEDAVETGLVLVEKALRLVHKIKNDPIANMDKRSGCATLILRPKSSPKPQKNTGF